jgi:hypothetical protein
LISIVLLQQQAFCALVVFCPFIPAHLNRMAELSDNSTIEHTAENRLVLARRALDAASSTDPTKRFGARKEKW